jgi:hypothetical protein
MGLVHPVPDYPTIGADSADAFFADIDQAGLVEAAGLEFAEVTFGLLAFDAGQRLSLDQAHQRLHAYEAEAARQAEAALQAQATHQAQAARQAEAALQAEAARQAGVALHAEPALQAEAARQAQAAPQAEAALQAHAPVPGRKVRYLTLSACNAWVQDEGSRLRLREVKLTPRAKVCVVCACVCGTRWWSG